jgi:hypothetical protein
MSGTEAGQPNIVFATDIVADKAIIHDNVRSRYNGQLSTRARRTALHLPTFW